MDYERQETKETTKEVTLVGMDAHSAKVSLCVTRWRHGSDPVTVKEVSTTLDALEATYKRQVPEGALTVLEASTNSFAIVRRLAAVGQGAKVLASDTLAGMARADRVNDRIDARNLALAYARGGTREVAVPSERGRRRRDVFFGYRNAVRDATRQSNRIWSFCSGHGFRLPVRSRARKAEGVRAQVLALGWDAEASFHAGRMLADYAHACETRDAYLRRIEAEVASDADMARAMQALGVRCVVAFALVAFVEDIARFPSAKRLVSYVGPGPRVCQTGESEGSRSVSRLGRRDLKSLLVEAAQSALRTGEAPMHRWARGKLAGGMHRNKAVCALARKMVVQLWHILSGHPAPGAEPEASFVLKLRKVARAVGKEGMARLGYKSGAEYAAAICASVRPGACAPESQARLSPPTHSEDCLE
jgi:transposase